MPKSTANRYFTCQDPEEIIHRHKSLASRWPALEPHFAVWTRNKASSSFTKCGYAFKAVVNGVCLLVIGSPRSGRAIFNNIWVGKKTKNAIGPLKATAISEADAAKFFIHPPALSPSSSANPDTKWESFENQPSPAIGDCTDPSPGRTTEDAAATPLEASLPQTAEVWGGLQNDGALGASIEQLDLENICWDEYVDIGAL